MNFYDTFECGPMFMFGCRGYAVSQFVTGPLPKGKGLVLCFHTDTTHATDLPLPIMPFLL